MKTIEKLLVAGAPVIDVRTPGEFAGGSVPGALNIPLNEIVERFDEIASMKQPIILCCASGNRSGQACYFLSEKGVDCVNGGGWMDVNYEITKKAS